MEDMHRYWQQEFKNAWVMLCEKLYLPDGYNYGKEKGITWRYNPDTDEYEEYDVLVEMISLKEQIEWDTKKGLIMRKFKYYTNRIYSLLGVEN